MLDKESEIFVMHVAALEALLAEMIIHPTQKAQIAALKQDKVLTKVPAKYSDFANIFSETKALVLPEQTEFNQHAIELDKSK